MRREEGKLKVDILSEKPILVSRAFMDIAERTLQSKDVVTLQLNEGVLRTAISRAYYAVFILARHILGLDLHKTPEVHRIVVEKLRELSKPLGDKLQELRRRRNEADYEVHATITINTLKQAHTIARTLLHELNKLKRPS